MPTINSDQTREDLKFEIAYSACYEKAMYKFLGRLVKLALLSLVVICLLLVATTWSGVLLSSINLIIATMLSIYSPSAKSQSAKQAYKEYYALYHQFDGLDTEAVRTELLKISEHETDEIGILAYPARLSALAMLGWVPENGYPQEPRKLNKLEYLAAFFAGEIPEYKF